MKVQFVGPAYQAPSLHQDAQRALNCYLEQDTKGGRPVGLYGCPGTVHRFSAGLGPIRGMLKQGSLLYLVSGVGVYKVDSTYTPTYLGSITTAAGPVGMASNGTEVIIVDGAAGWLATSSALTQITDVDFPNGVTMAAYVSSYFIVAADESGKAYWSEVPNSGASWNALDFATAEGAPDPIVGMVSNQLELWMAGSDSVEIWGLTSDPAAPFQRIGNAFIETGCASGATVCKGDNTVFWLGVDQRGGPVVFRAQGYSPVRISTYAIERAMHGYASISDAIAYTYQQGGHLFYVLTFPSASATWCYDVATSEWHERAYRNPSTGALMRHRSNCHAYFNSDNLVGDFQDGRVYAFDPDVYTDDGDPILRLRATPATDSQDGERIFYESLQIDMDTGIGGLAGSKLMLRYSNDGGRTWSNRKEKSIGKSGEYSARVKFGPTGASRNRAWEISMTDNAPFVVTGAYVRSSGGSS